MHNYESTTKPRPARTAPSAPPVSTAAAPLSPRPLYQEVAERLREQIFERRLEPGSWIDEQKLAAEFGISRTPLREALKVLAVEGLVTMRLRRGAYVTETSAADLAQVYHLLALLESDAAAQVAANASAAQIAELQAIHDRLESQVRRRDAFFATNEQFHLAVLRVAGNRWAQQIVADLRKVMKLNRQLSLLEQGRLVDSLAEHRAVMAAIAARDSETARARMRAHFDRGLEAASASISGAVAVPVPAAAAGRGQRRGDLSAARSASRRAWPRRRTAGAGGRSCTRGRRSSR